MANPYTDNTASARSYLSFQLNFMALMISAGRVEEAQAAMRKLAVGIEQLPEDLHVNVASED